MKESLPEDEESLNFLTGSLYRPAPCVLEATIDELNWLHPLSLSEPVWGESSCAHTTEDEAHKELSMPYLWPSSQDEGLFKDESEEQRKLKPATLSEDSMEVTLLQFSRIVEQNRTLAVALVSGDLASQVSNGYLEKLSRLQLSAHLLEVVKILSTLHELPVEFWERFITGCMYTCQQLEDRLKQHRMVRLVCVFLRSLIQRNVLSAKDLLLQMESFCIEFIGVKEAGVLFRELKSNE